MGLLLHGISLEHLLLLLLLLLLSLGDWPRAANSTVSKVALSLPSGAPSSSTSATSTKSSPPSPSASKAPSASASQSPSPTASKSRSSRKVRHFPARSKVGSDRPRLHVHLHGLLLDQLVASLLLLLHEALLHFWEWGGRHKVAVR